MRENESDLNGGEGFENQQSGRGGGATATLEDLW